MKILHYLSYYFPPIPSIASKRNDYLFSLLSESFDKATIYTTRNRRFFESDDVLDHKYNVHVLPTLDYRTLILLSKRKSPSIHVDESRKQGNFIRFLIKLNETLPFSIFFGEGGLLYIVSAVVQILKHTDRQSDQTVFTSYRPAANILAGYIIKLMRPKVRWVVSMHDLPFVRKKPNTYFPAFQKRIWRKFLQKADKVIAVSEGQQSALRDYGIQPMTLYNGVEIRTPVSTNNAMFTIAFTGSVYKGLMDPGILFKCLQQMIHSGDLEASKLKIIYAGKDGMYWMHLLDSQYPEIAACTENRSMLSQNEALKIQENANINYLMTWNDIQEQGILTGKFFEYLGARNPIITLVNGNYDQEFESIFTTLKCGAVFYTQDKDYEDKMQQFIKDKYNLWLSGKYQNTYTVLDGLTEWTWEKRKNQLMDQLNN